MELQFEKSTSQCLRTIASGVQTREETQEVRLSESMPDIGRVLGCWGQICVRSKEWRSDGIRVSGGVTVWVMYAPEDGSAPRSVESWIPFQAKWDYGESARDGFICVQPLLKSADARSVSPRKMIVRVCVSLLGEALEPSEWEIHKADALPEDVQLLVNTYPVELPSEAGEKLFQAEYDEEVPKFLLDSDRILYYTLCPRIAEHKVMVNRLVFRGTAALHVLYTDEEGGIGNWECEIPFSQYTELEREHEGNAEAKILPVLTSLEFTSDEERPNIKCSMTAQYVLYDRQLVDVVEDGYSTKRKMQLQKQMLTMPVRLDSRTETVQLSQTASADCRKVLDVCWNMSHPEILQAGDSAEFLIQCGFQVLYLDEENKLQCAAGKASEQWNMPSASHNRILAAMEVAERPAAAMVGDGIAVECSTVVEVEVFAQQGLETVTGVQLGETVEPDPDRPSVVLRRPCGARLWDIAKANQTTVEAIKAANRLQEEPEGNRVLLIPIP